MTPSGIPDLLERARAGHRGALARLVSVVERDGPDAEEIAARIAGTPPAAHVVGVTGPPGAGKSTLVGRLVAHAVAGGMVPAVVAVDPSSPITGGAILGDRVRMDVPEPAFVRSMATRGQIGGLSAAVPGVLRLLDHVGFDPVLVETAGVGQVEVEIAATADTAVLVTAPGWGDAVQAAKAGLLEVADVLVVNKADRPGADALLRDLEQMLELGNVSGLEGRLGHGRTIVMADALSGGGVDAVATAVASHREWLGAGGGLRERRARRARAEVAARAERLLARHVAEALGSDAGRRGLRDLEAGRATPAGAARALVDALRGGRTPAGTA